MTLYVKPGRVGASDPSGVAMARSVAGCRIQHRRSNYKKSLLKVLSPAAAPAPSSPSAASLPSRPRVKRVVTYEHGRLETVLLPLLVSSTLARGGRAASATGRINLKTTNKPKNMMNAKKNNATNVPEHEGIATADAEGFWQQLAQAEVEDIQSSNNKNQLEMSAYDADIKQELPDYDDASSVDSGDHAYFGGSDDDTETPQVRRSPDNAAASFAMRAPTRPFAMVKEEPMEMEREQPAPAPVPSRAPAQTRPAAAKIAAGDNTKVFIDTLLHSLDCKSCPSNACQKMRLVLGHFLTCSKNKSRTEQEKKTCALCNQLIGIVTRHAREQCDARARGVACPVPMCDVITEEDELEQERI